MARVVIITGGSGGVGTAVTTRWLADGLNVVVVSDSEHHLESLQDHPKLHKVVSDVSTEEGADSVIEQAHRFGEPNTLIHLVGAFSMGPIDADDAVSRWQRMMTLNLDSTFYCFRAMIRAMPPSGGYLLAVGSKAAETHPGRMAGYVVSKAGVIALVKSLSDELKGKGIHVNAILPSTVDTPANRTAMGMSHAAKWVTPEDIAEATAYLCNERGRALFGTTLEVYGLS
jgi:NAD(P)-dependent dehydrogenase (short-subunit alcohol dehydrogenase family)